MTKTAQAIAHGLVVDLIPWADRVELKSERTFDGQRFTEEFHVHAWEDDRHFCGSGNTPLDAAYDVRRKRNRKPVTVEKDDVMERLMTT